MKFKFILLLPCLFYFSCTNEPTNEYQLDKEALIKAQNDYENSTIQHQKVQSKSIITITKNEKKVLAMIEIFQNWKLDSLEKRFKPIEAEAEAKLTYFDGQYRIRPEVSEVYFHTTLGRYIQSVYLNFDKGKSSSSRWRGTKEKISLNTDYNGVSIPKEYGGEMSNEIIFGFGEFENKHEKLLLKIGNHYYEEISINWGNGTIDFQIESAIFMNPSEIRNLNPNRNEL
jgi:hypothetical protein